MLLLLLLLLLLTYLLLGDTYHPYPSMLRCCATVDSVDNVLEQPPAARAANTIYSSPDTIIDAVRSGHAVLLRGTWLLQRAGFTEVEESMEVSGGAPFLPKKRVAVRKWVRQGSDHVVLPLPDRRQIEAEHSGAIFGVAELVAAHAKHLETISAADEGQLTQAVQNNLGALPVIAVSHCWESAEHPDPAARTLCRVAERLAGKFSPQAEPLDGLPLFRAWGFADVGCMVDWSSLYQKPRTAPQEACFRAALASMSIWYAHRLTTVMLVWGQDEYLAASRSVRGWPFYEQVPASRRAGWHQVGRWIHL